MTSVDVFSINLNRHRDFKKSYQEFSTLLLKLFYPRKGLLKEDLEKERVA